MVTFKLFRFREGVVGWQKCGPFLGSWYSITLPKMDRDFDIPPNVALFVAGAVVRLQNLLSKQEPSSRAGGRWTKTVVNPEP